MAIQPSYIHRITPQVIEKCTHNSNALILIVDSKHEIPTAPTHYIRYCDYTSMAELETLGWREVNLQGEPT
jgi:hypothetical protein